MFEEILSFLTISYFSTENVRKIVSEAYMMLKSKLPGIMESMSLYLASKETEYILFKPIKVSLVYFRNR